MSNKSKRSILTFFCFLVWAFIILQYFRLDIFSPKTTLMWRKIGWCFAWVMFGIGVRGFEKITDKEIPIRDYFEYLFTALVLCVVIFAVLNMHEATKGAMFYPLSFSICTFVGFNVFLLSDLGVKVSEWARGRPKKNL